MNTKLGDSQTKTYYEGTTGNIYTLFKKQEWWKYKEHKGKTTFGN